MAASLPAAGDQQADDLMGLTRVEVEARMAAGQVNLDASRPSRTIGHIVRANVFTRFNAILGALLAVIVVVGPIQDALFGIVLVANTLIGIIQEVRAKRALDHLAVLAAPKVIAWRDGEPVELPVESVVLDDVLRVRPGDQVVVDGLVLRAEALEIDESLLTGESEPVGKVPGDEVLSGSFAAAGNGWYRATRVGADAYAATLARAAREFTLVRSELRAGIDRILRVVTWVMVPTAVLLVSSQLINNEDLDDALRGSVAGVGSMIPEGLVLLTSVAMAVGVVRLGHRGVLVQELAAIEVLARVDVVCFDKTGTLTEGSMAVAGMEALGRADGREREALGALAAADSTPNASMRAVATAFPAPEGWDAQLVVPFSSARKWSGVDFGPRGAWILGAPEVLLDQAPAGAATDAVAATVARQAGEGQRVLLLARSPSALGGQVLPARLEPVALISLEDRIRQEAAATLEYFAQQGVAMKVLSGDDPLTVGAIARRLGLDATGHGVQATQAGHGVQATQAAEAVDARGLPDGVDALSETMERHVVFGRVSPQQKQDMVAALQARGHVVAMVGDGVNDVLALKDSDIGVAFGSGSSASRSVAQLVLVENSFDSLPAVVGEGRRVIANVERVANLFLTKTVYATLLALAVGVARLPFPFLPRHLTIVTALTIGTPAFFLALAPSAARAQPHFVRRVLSFAIPAGTVAAAATFVAYALIREEGTPLPEARTAATIVLFAVGFWVLTAVARPLTTARRWLLAGLAAAFVGVLALPGLREFFGLELPSPLSWASIAIVAGVAIVVLESGWRVATRFHYGGGVAPSG